mgnify:FL=1
MKENEVKIGQTVYFQEHWSGVIQDAKVMDILPMEDQKRYPGKKYAKLKCEIGTCGALLENVYPSFKACKEAVQKTFIEKVEKYKAEMKTVRDLIIFPLKQTVEYSDDAARRAYKERAEELGFITSKEMETEDYERN